AVTWMSVVGAVGDPELGADLLRLLHAEQDMEFIAPLRPGDEITTVAKVASIEARPGGEAMTLELNARNRADAPVLRTLFGILIRAARRDRAAAGRAERPVSPPGAPMLTVEQTIDRDQTFRYAEASGDRNPIHVDENVAKMAGLPGIVVHGLCTMAFASKVMIDGLCGGDPVQLKRLRVQFSRPVFPGQSITTRVWASGERAGRRAYAFGTYNPAAMGRQAEAAIKLFVDDLNAAGGVRIGGRPYELTLRCNDDQSDARRCAEIYRALCGPERVDLLLGPYSSRLARA